MGSEPETPADVGPPGVSPGVIGEKRSRSEGLPIRRLVALFVVLTVLPLGLLAYLSVDLASDAVTSEVRARLRSTAQASVVAVEKEMQGTAAIVTSYAQRPSLRAELASRGRGSDTREIVRHLRELKQVSPAFANTAVVDPRGRLIAVVPATPSIIGKDFSFRDWYRGVTAGRGKPYAGEAIESKATGRARVVPVATYVYAPDQSGPDAKVVGILVAAYSLESIQKFAERFASSQGVSLALTDQRGVLIAAPGDVLRGLRSTRNHPWVAAALAGRSGVTTRDTPDGRVLSAYAPLAGLGWTVTASVHERPALASVGRLRSAVMTITGILGLVLVGGLLVVVRTLRGRQRAEREAESNRVAAERAKAEAERANRAKSDFLSRMSHELRTPLNAVLGFGQLLEMEQLETAQRESVEQILKGGTHLLGLINEVLDISRIEAGRLSLSMEPVSVAETVAEALDLVQPIAAERGISLTGDLSDDLQVLADRQRLKQVLLNLLSNAIKYNREGGSVRIGPIETENGRIRIDVADTGSGIAPERLDKLFVPFERLGADQSGVEGAGLGLALSKGLVEAMGGDLTVQSRLGEGTIFSLELTKGNGPVNDASDRAERPLVADNGRNGSVKRLLYIEDNLSNLKLIEQVLEHRPDVELVPAMQGRLGLDLAREHRFDLVLLDLHLPDLPGGEVLAELRREPSTRNVPVVILSADATPGRIERLLDQGAAAFLTKPLDVKRFLELLDEHPRIPEPAQPT
jgi:signal transduction histidine kinase/ActR/RegA family two-component response regulator